MGADNPYKQEIHPAVMARSKIVCDVIEQCATMGDLHHALNAGVVKMEDVHAQLGEIVASGSLGGNLRTKSLSLIALEWRCRTLPPRYSFTRRLSVKKPAL